MKFTNTAKYLLAIMWVLIGLVFIGVFISLLGDVKANIAYSSESAEKIFVVVGLGFIVEGFVVYFTKKTACIIAVPVAVFSVFVVVGQLSSIFNNSLVTYKYIFMGLYMMTVSIFTIILVLFPKTKLAAKNA
ncbi:hypothetical protein NBRC116493_02580 [Aurantivibrio infirmus]